MCFPTRSQLKIKRALARQATRRRQMLHIVPRISDKNINWRLNSWKSLGISCDICGICDTLDFQKPPCFPEKPENLSCRICTRARENYRNLENLWKCLVTSVTFVTKIHFHENLWTFPVTSMTIVTEYGLEIQYQICLCFVRDPRSVSLPSEGQLGVEPSGSENPKHKCKRYFSQSDRIAGCTGERSG